MRCFCPEQIEQGRCRLPQASRQARSAAILEGRREAVKPTQRLVLVPPESEGRSHLADPLLTLHEEAFNRKGSST